MKKKILIDFCTLLEESGVGVKIEKSLISLNFNEVSFGKIELKFKSGKHVKFGADCSFSVDAYINSENITDNKFKDLGARFPEIVPEVNDFFDSNDTKSNFKVHGSELGKVNATFKHNGIVSIFPEMLVSDTKKILTDIIDCYVFPMMNYFFGKIDTIKDINKYPMSYKYPLITAAIISSLNNENIFDLIHSENLNRFSDYKKFLQVFDKK